MYKGIERDTKKVWAVKTMMKSNIKREEEENLKVTLLIVTMVRFLA